MTNARPSRPPRGVPAGQGFGRRIPTPDPRDKDFPLRALLPRRIGTLPDYKNWAFNFPPLNQGQTGTCVAHGTKDWMLSKPIVDTAPGVAPDPFDMYRAFVLLDEWPDNDNEANLPNAELQDGTSVHAAGKWLVANGWLGAYHWAQTLADMQNFVSLQGPIIIGVNWYNGMMNPNGKGFIKATGGVVGGHCVCIIGCNNNSRYFTIVNSWGAWGINGSGKAKISFADMQQLIFGEGGEAMAGLELQRPA